MHTDNNTTMQKSSAIIQEGLALRSKSGTKGWICVSCNHVMSFLDFSGGCPNCTSKRIHPIKSPERLRNDFESIGNATGIDKFFGTDDNFFNNRETVEHIFTAMAQGYLVRPARGG